MANINRRWRRVMAIGCTHGEFVSPKLLKQVYSLTASFKPDLRIHLGDLVDTAAWRGGAHNTPDEARPIQADYASGVRLIEEWQPTHIAWGNHDWRLEEACQHPNAIKAYAAQQLWTGLQDAARKVGAHTRPYHIMDGWFRIGGIHWGHGYMFNENALRDHAEMIGGPVVMAHIHTAQSLRGRTRDSSESFCVGTLADRTKLKYAHRQRSFSRWCAGLVYGEVTENNSKLWLLQENKDGLLSVPPNLL